MSPCNTHRAHFLLALLSVFLAEYYPCFEPVSRLPGLVVGCDCGLGKDGGPTKGFGVTLWRVVLLQGISGDPYA